MTQNVSKKIVLYFSRETWDKPIVYRLVKDHDLVFNILRAQVLPRQESYMVMELSGTQANYRKGIRYLKDCGITVKLMEKDIQRDEQLCYHCGACIAMCPTRALRMQPDTMEIVFDNKLCTGCGLCMPTCPSRAMQVALV
jgi:ferredoxin